jgi:urease accessory protein
MSAMGRRAGAAQLARVEPLPCERGTSSPAARTVTGHLQFHVGGGRTRLGRQRVPYPFHVTRAFYLDPERPDIATLYLQSASGGLYRGDRVTLEIAAADGAAAHVTTQSATIVHDTRGQGAMLATHIAVGAGAFLAYTPDPLVLFPGAAIESATDITLDEGASVLLCDGFAWHDPDGTGRAFGGCAFATTVRDRRGRTIICDRGAIGGTHCLGPSSPLGPYRAAGTMLVLGRGSNRLDPKAFEARLDELGCLAGVNAAPGGVGQGARILAPDGGTLACGLAAAFALGFMALTGVQPSSRRK